MQRIKTLLERFLANEANSDEVRELLQCLRERDDNEELLQEVWNANLQEAPPADLQRVWMQVEAETRPEPRGVVRRIVGFWPAIAAAILVAAAGVFLLGRQDRPTGVITAKAASAPDAVPGKNGAILTLADGSRVSLDSAGSGVPALQGGAKLALQDHRLTYAATNEAAALVYNIVTTPRGRQFSLVLPDGTHVWLNAASSIRFPTAFTGGQRRVELTGEAYFEVAKDKDRPFFVHTEKSETEVLGTAFDVNAYADEATVRTTLVEGSVRIGVGQEKVILQPGEQAQMGERIIVDHKADVGQVTAWKDGIFDFQNVGLKEVMRQLARWYDLEVEYEPGVKDVKFGGEMSRNILLSSLLKALKDMDVHFRLEQGHKLIVMP